MKSRVVINVLLAFIILPIIKLSFDFINIEIRGDHSVYSGTFLAYEKLIASSVFILLPLFFLAIILLPYNSIVVSQKKFKLTHKIFILNGLMLLVLCTLGIFINVWRYPYWKNIYYEFYFFPISALFSSLIHLWVDKKIGK